MGRMKMAVLKSEKTKSESYLKSFDSRSLIGNILILVAWGWLFYPLADYLTVIFSREDFRTNQILLVGIVVLLIVQMQKGNLRPKLDAPPQLRLRPFLLFLVYYGLRDDFNSTEILAFVPKVALDQL